MAPLQGPSAGTHTGRPALERVHVTRVQPCAVKLVCLCNYETAQQFSDCIMRSCFSIMRLIAQQRRVPRGTFATLPLPPALDVH